MPKSPKISPKVMYPCIFLAFYMSVRKLQGFITFHFLAFLEVFLKCYISLYLSYTHIEGKENTRICNFWWNVTYPCIFLALYMCVRKIQGYVTFQRKKVEKLHILVFSLHIILQSIESFQYLKTDLATFCNSTLNRIHKTIWLCLVGIVRY